MAVMAWNKEYWIRNELMISWRRLVGLTCWGWMQIWTRGRGEEQLKEEWEWYKQMSQTPTMILLLLWPYQHSHSSFSTASHLQLQIHFIRERRTKSYTSTRSLSWRTQSYTSKRSLRFYNGFTYHCHVPESHVQSSLRFSQIPNVTKIWISLRM